MKAADTLAGEGINARVIDLYSVKPVDADTLRAAARETGSDHHRRGPLPGGRHRRRGAGCAGGCAGRGPSFASWPSRIMPGSATPAEQLAAAGIDAEHIAAAARELVGARAGAEA